MNYWMLFLTWAACLACAAPLANPSAPATTSAANDGLALVGSSWASDALMHSEAKGHTIAIVDALKESYSKKTIREPYPAGANSNSTESSKNVSSPGVGGDGSDVGDFATEPYWQHSLQILLQSHLDRHTWYMFQGPYGVAVNPCNPGPFKTVVKDYGDGRKLNFYDPPYVAAGVKWDLNIEGWSDRGHCKYEGRAEIQGILFATTF